MEKELAKKKLATASEEGLAVQAASDKKALEIMMKEREESARRVDEKIAEVETRFKSAEARATAAERQLAVAQRQLQTLTTELFSQKKLFEQAEGEADWLRVELKQQAKLVTQAERDVVQLRTEFEGQKKLYAIAINEASHLRAVVDGLDASNRARTAQFAILEQEKETMKAEITKLTKCFNDSLHAANAAKKEIEDQKAVVVMKSVASTESIAVVAQDQVEETKTEEQELIPVIFSRADYRAERKTSSLQRWLASLVEVLALIPILQPVLTAPAVKTFFQKQALSDDFLHQEQNQSLVKKESISTFLPKAEPTPEITATPDDYHGSNAFKCIGIDSVNTISPAQPTTEDTALELTSLAEIIN